MCNNIYMIFNLCFIRIYLLLQILPSLQGLKDSNKLCLLRDMYSNLIIILSLYRSTVCPASWRFGEYCKRFVFVCEGPLHSVSCEFNKTMLRLRLLNNQSWTWTRGLWLTSYCVPMRSTDDILWKNHLYWGLQHSKHNVSGIQTAHVWQVQEKHESSVAHILYFYWAIERFNKPLPP